jgi:cellulose synthase/poly-beta-1,6-N-acetylglucosamine synthase-like glycosyltransferase
MQTWEIIFFAGCFILVYNYFGYAIIAKILLLLFKPSQQINQNYTPTVSFIVAAYNEEDFIEQKIRNSLEQDYPAGLIEYIFVTDGSTDKTPSIVASFSQIKLLHSPARKGKSAAVNRAVAMAANEILIFSDANTLLNKEAVQQIARHYSDTAVGGVAGEKKVVSTLQTTGELSENEGLYWKYESALKQIDSDFYSVVGAAGELFSVRRALYEPIHSSVILDDFVISLKIAEQGKRIVYEPGAFACEEPSFSISEEQKRKVRIAAGGFQAIVMLGSLFQFWKHPKLFFLYFSHRVLRWTLSPLSLPVVLMANFILVICGSHIIYLLVLIAQGIFYGTAALAYFSPGALQRLKFIKIPYYFVFMNLAVYAGFFRYLKGSQSAAWEKARRKQ